MSCDLPGDYNAITQRYWYEAGVDSRLERRLGLAMNTSRALLDEGLGESYDLTFIDADQADYPEYLEMVPDLAGWSDPF